MKSPKEHIGASSFFGSYSISSRSSSCALLARSISCWASSRSPILMRFSIVQESEPAPYNRSSARVRFSLKWMFLPRSPGYIVPLGETALQNPIEGVAKRHAPMIRLIVRVVPLRDLFQLRFLSCQDLNKAQRQPILGCWI